MAIIVTLGSRTWLCSLDMGITPSSFIFGFFKMAEYTRRQTRFSGATQAKRKDEKTVLVVLAVLVALVSHF